MQESWKQIPGFEGFYEVSNTGLIRSVERKVNNRWFTNKGRLIPSQLKAFSKSSQGYLSVHMYKNSHLTKQYVHRLVALAFIPNPENKLQVNHLDGDKSNNSVENLEWCNGSENCHHAIHNNIYQQARGERSGNVKLKESDIPEIRRLASVGELHKDIANIFGVGRKAITKIVNKQRWKHVA